MKRTLRWLTAPAWWASKPLRRALMGRFDARVVRLASRSIDERMLPPLVEAMAASDARLERIERLMARADRSASKMAEEVDLVLNGLSREIFRLQSQVEWLRNEDRPMVGGLSLHEGSDEDPAASPEDVPTERSKVG
jgi:hypothetical protein